MPASPVGQAQAPSQHRCQTRACRPHEKNAGCAGAVRSTCKFPCPPAPQRSLLTNPPDILSTSIHVTKPLLSSSSFMARAFCWLPHCTAPVMRHARHARNQQDRGPRAQHAEQLCMCLRTRALDGPCASTEEKGSAKCGCGLGTLPPSTQHPPPSTHTHTHTAPAGPASYEIIKWLGAASSQPCWPPPPWWCCCCW